MFVIIASLALASDPALEDSRLAPETESEIIIEVESSEDLMEYSLLEGSEEVAWGQAAVDLEGRVHLGHELGSGGDLQLLLTPIDDEGFTVGPTVTYEIQAALGRGTRSPSSRADTRTELL